MCPDEQAALEKMFGFYSHMASGVTNIWGLGQLESELTISPAQAVIDDEMIAYAKRYLRGVEVNDTTLALDITRAVGIGGNYLDQLHTAEHFKNELFMPKILLRRKRDAWEADGKKRLDEVAEARARELMKKDVDHGLTAAQVKELEKIKNGFLKKM
jgi:trimethylamine--corrinoid protein Co-methyltransferase